jgi:hypothetical protein
MQVEVLRAQEDRLRSTIVQQHKQDTAEVQQLTTKVNELSAQISVLHDRVLEKDAALVSTRDAATKSVEEWTAAKAALTAQLQQCGAECDRLRDVCTQACAAQVCHTTMCLLATWLYHRVPKFSPYGSVCCACAPLKGLACRASPSRAR